MKDKFNSILHQNLNRGNKTKQLRQLFSIGCSESLNLFGKFINNARKTRQQNYKETLKRKANK